MITLTADHLREILHYDQQTGEMLWKWRQDVSECANKRWAGKVAGTRNSGGYCQIKINGKVYLRHILARLYITGKWPADEVDHKNRVRGDDRYDNLRPATHAQNRCNNSIYSTNSSGFIGVYWHAKNEKWCAMISINNKSIYLGSFNSRKKAAATYDQAAKARGAEFARTNLGRAA